MNTATQKTGRENSGAELRKEIAGWTRWLHIYLSMFSFAVMLFFGATGITLNHPDWLAGDDQVRSVHEQLPATLLNDIDSVPLKRLETVEYFREHFAIRSRLVNFSNDEMESSVSFKGPGYSADAFIDNATGFYELTITESGLVALMNDLHKGRDSGPGWAILIDISAVMMILVSLTGYIMIFFLRKKRQAGLLLFFAGLLLLVVSYFALAQ